MTDSIQTVLRESSISISQYKEAVAKYKNAQSKSEKQDLETFITEIKSKLKTEINRRDARLVRLNKRRSELANLQAPQLFEPTKKEKKASDKRIADLKKEIATLENIFEEIRSNKIYLGAFEWRIEFPEVLDAEGNFLGFDCIIGNPPYIQLQSMGKSADVLECMGYITYARTGDIYCLFYELGMNLLTPNGFLCYITSNKWMRAGYGEALRGYFASKTNPIMLVDFAGIKIFDAITVEANILLSQKAANIFNTQACLVQDSNGLNNLSDFVQQQGVKCNFADSIPWVILSPIEQSIKQKIESVGIPLKDWNIQINYGIKTGFNDAFIISTEKRDEILANCQTEDERVRTAELIRPILRGRDIKRYEYEWADLWIIATFPSRHYDIESYPAVKNYLLSIGIERLEQTGETHIVNGKKIKARKKTSNEWFETQDSISYWEDFSKPKIVWAELARTGNAFALDFGNNMVGNTGYILTVPSNNQDELLYLLAFLNSRSMLYSLNQITTRFDENGWRWLRQFVEQLRVPPLINKNEILSIVATVTKDNKQEVSEILNNVIADIYNFTDEEKAYINQTLSNY